MYPQYLWQSWGVGKLLELLLRALVPLLERRCVAAEQQAQSTARLEDLLRTYLCYQDPDFLQLLQGTVPLADSSPVDVQYDSGAARDLKASRLEELRTLWYTQHGELLDDDRLVAEYDRLYEEADSRFDGNVAAGVQ